MDDKQQVMNIEVAYAERDKQAIKALQVPVGTTAIQAVEISEIRGDFPQIPADDQLELGIFSKQCPHDQTLQPGDRVEIYRPLIIDPKEARRLKAEVAEKRKQAGQPSAD